MSITELRFKLLNKGLDKNLIEDYIYNNKEDLLEYEINSAKGIITRQNKEKKGMISYLMKKGYKRDSINEAYEEIEKGE